MAEIYDPASHNTSAIQGNTWIVMFNELSTEEGRRAHIDLVKRLNAHSAGIGAAVYYEGVQREFEHLKGYAGQFRPEVVTWIESQGDVDRVYPDAEVSIDE